MEKKYSCLPTCRPFRPCGIPGCPNIGDVQVGVDVNGAVFRNYGKNITDNDVIGGRGKAPMSTVENDADRDNSGGIDQNKILDSDSNVDIGIGNTAESDSNMEVFRNQVRGGRPGANVRVGAANYADQDNNVYDPADDVDISMGNTAGRILRCLPSCRSFRPCCVPGCPYMGDVLVGVDNRAGRDNNMEIENNYDRGGSGAVRVGGGNLAGRDNMLFGGWNKLGR